ncbi:DUF1593 domain-containing protein [Lewinella sp. W8]|nr:DUF1593 domain-containing protein [Lewinella sp. W8]
MRLAYLVFIVLLSTGLNGQNAGDQPRPRIVITADPELDDNNSLIRFLLYSTDLNIEGLVYASSQFHWSGDGKGTKWFVPGREYDRFGMGVCPCESWRWAEDERFIHDVVEAYERVYPNLKKHHPGYPTPDYLKSKIRYGNIEFDGDISKDSPGSKLIESLILDDKPGPLFLAAWGGHSTIARALKSIQETYEYTTEWEALRRKISRKVVLLPSGDQDDTYARYIKPNWPDIEYRQFRDGPNYGYGAQLNASPANAGYLTPSWMKENVRDRGPLGELYRVWGDGKQMVEGDKVDYFGLSGHSNEELRDMGYFVWMPVQPQGSWLGEGDNHTFMNMLGNGLRAYEDAAFGGWGGRGVVEEASSSGAFSSELNADEMADNMEALNRQLNGDELAYPNFFPQAQRDFANRLKWSVTETYANANHDPEVGVMGPLSLMANAGQKIRLHGLASDPDGDEVTVRWWQFHVGSYPGKVEITNAENLNADIQIPEDARGGQTIHLILEATDKGVPSLTRYARVIITVRD